MLAKLTAAKLPITDGAVQDENTDPNNPAGQAQRVHAESLSRGNRHR